MEIKQIFVSSENRNTQQHPYGNSYTLYITTPIKDIYKAEILYASVPNVLYNISDGSNVMSFSNLVSSTGNPLTTFSMSQGFYNATSLASEITQTISNVTGITVTYLSSEGRFLFTRPISYGKFYMNVTSTELSSMVGFETSVTYESQNVATQSGLTIPLYSDHVRYRDKEFIKSEKIINLSPNEGIFLDINELRTPLNEDAKMLIGNTYDGRNISRTFGLIPMDVPGGGVKHFKKTSDYDFMIEYPQVIRSLDRLTIKWIDRHGQIVSFNGLEDNSFVLRLYTLKKNM